MNVSAKLEQHVLTLSIDIVPSDYTEEYNNRLRTERKRMTLKGFRPGQVPKGVAEKMVGEKLRLDAVMQVFDRAIGDYMRENNYTTFSQVLLDSPADAHNYREAGEYSYEVSVGIAPEYKLDTDMQMAVSQVKIDDAFLEKEVEKRREEFRDLEECEVVPAEGVVTVRVEELDEKGALLADGYVADARHIDIANVVEEKRALLVGKKKGEPVDIEDMQAFISNAYELGVVLETREELYSHSFRLTITQPKEWVKGEENLEFYSKFMQPAEGEEALPDDMPELRERLRAQLQREQDFYVRNLTSIMLSNKLVEDWDFSVSPDFLKRAFPENPLETEEQLAELMYSIKRFCLDVALRPEDPKELEGAVDAQDQMRVLMEFTRQFMEARGYGQMASNAYMVQVFAQQIMGQEETMREYQEYFTHFAIMRRAAGLINVVETSIDASEANEDTELVSFGDAPKPKRKTAAKKASKKETAEDGAEEKPKRATRKKKDEGEGEEKPAPKKRATRKKKEEE